MSRNSPTVFDNLGKLFKPLFSTPQSREVEENNRRRRIQYLKRKYSTPSEDFDEEPAKKKRSKS